MARKDRMSGNEAVSFAIRQINPDVMPAFPITPSTEIPQMVSTYIANGEIDTEFVPVESEHSAMSAAIGSEAAGARTLTATSSAGLALMWEELLLAASNRMPIALALVNRTLSGPINITLSLGERSKESYQKLYDAGADRYLLRHEAADPELYQKLHPESLSLENRIQCLWNLKEIGYAVGTGFMVGAPYQTVENLADDLLFIKELDPQMVGIGPFVPHHDTKFKEFPSGSVELTTYLVSILRLMNPHLLLPSTTALGTIDPRGREKGILAGANVVMPNLSPVAVRKDYSLYDNKICTGEEAAECAGCLGRRLASIDYQLVFSRGDYIE